MKTLFDYLSSKSNMCFETNSPAIYSIFRDTLNIELVSNTNEQCDISIIIQKYISNLPNIRFDHLKLKKYSNIVDEASAALSYLKENPKCYIATDNIPLLETLYVMSCHFRPADQFTESEIINVTAKALFSLNNQYFIDYLYSGKYISINKENQIHGNLLKYKINHIIHSNNLIFSEQYNFEYLKKMHNYFINQISPYQIDLKNFNIDAALSPLDYIQTIKELTDQHYIALRQHNSKLRIGKLNEIFLFSDINEVWVCGNTALTKTEYKYLNLLKNMNILLSFPEFQDNITMSPHPLLHDLQIQNQCINAKSIKCVYKSPCPSIERRGTSFAISHITKLLNNPYSYYVEVILNLKQFKFHSNHILGIIAHDIFENWLKNQMNAKTQNNLDTMRKTIQDSIQEYNLSKREQLLIHNKMKTMTDQLHLIAQNAHELYAEYEGMQEIIYNAKTYKLHGRADLIYKTINNEYGIIDFKTGIPPSITNIMNGKSPQISLEILMLKFGGFINEKNIKITDSGFISPKGLFKINKDNTLIEASLDGIQEILKLFWDNMAPYSLRLKEMHCPYKLISRQWIIDGEIQ